MVQIFFRLFVKGGFAAWGAEVIGLALIFRRCYGRFLVYFHATYRIDGHDSFLRILANRYQFTYLVTGFLHCLSEYTQAHIFSNNGNRCSARL